MAERWIILFFSRALCQRVNNSQSKLAHEAKLPLKYVSSLTNKPCPSKQPRFEAWQIFCHILTGNQPPSCWCLYLRCHFYKHPSFLRIMLEPPGGAEGGGWRSMVTVTSWSWKWDAALWFLLTVRSGRCNLNSSCSCMCLQPPPSDPGKVYEGN